MNTEPTHFVCDRRGIQKMNKNITDTPWYSVNFAFEGVGTNPV